MTRKRLAWARMPSSPYTASRSRSAKLTMIRSTHSDHVRNLDYGTRGNVACTSTGAAPTDGQDYFLYVGYQIGFLGLKMIPMFTCHSISTGFHENPALHLQLAAQY